MSNDYIGMDVFDTNHGQSGVGSFILSFISNLPPGCKLSLFGDEKDKFIYSSGRDIDYKVIDCRVKRQENLWHNLFASRFFENAPYKAVLFPNVERVIIPKTKTPSVAVLNCVPNFDAKAYDELQELHLLKKNLSRATHIIAASDYIKKSAMLLGLDEKKISVVYSGVDHKLFFPAISYGNDDDAVNIKPFAIQKPYFVYGSRLSGPQKKHIELIKAFDSFKEKTSLPHRLVLCGGGGAWVEEVHKAAFNAKHASEIFITGYFSHESFSQLYASCDGCIFPSITEGVGLPVIEALSSGVPVACSKKGALSEVAADCAIYFDSDDPEDLEKALITLATDKKKRADLIKKGISRAAVFNWDDTVKKTLSIIDEICANK